MDQKRVDECYATPNDKEALECVKDFVRKAQYWVPSCRPKLILLTQERCVPCNEEKATHKKAIDEGLIQVLDIDTPEGRVIATKNEVELLPALLLLDCQDMVIYPSD